MVSYLEKILIRRCQQGDNKAFASLLKLYKKQLFIYLSRRCGNTDLAEDLFQETCIKIWKNIKKYKEKEKFGSWIFSIAYNVSVDDFRKRKLRRKDFIRKDLDLISNENEVIKNIEINDEKKLLSDSISRLSDIQREVFLLRQHGELTFKEISEILNQPLNTVLSHMNYAVKKLKRMLRKENV